MAELMVVTRPLAVLSCDVPSCDSRVDLPEAIHCPEGWLRPRIIKHLGLGGLLLDVAICPRHRFAIAADEVVLFVREAAS